MKTRLLIVLVVLALAAPSAWGVTCQEQRNQREAEWQNTVTACSATFGVTVCTWWYADDWDEIQQDYADCVLFYGM